MSSVVRDRAFYDVFISYRHHDKERIDQLECKVRGAGFEPFRDLNFPALGDTSDVTRAKIETIRAQLSRSTCLIFAYSHASAAHDQVAGQSLGVWMPWELGFFDGAISSRIGVYLLDGPRGAEDPRSYFKGCEYLQLYEELTDSNLDGFLRRNAVRERRIDNVAPAFVWLEHLFRECLANPANVNLGLAEWFADHAARFWQAQGNAALANAFGQLKVTLDDVRVTAAPAWRFTIYDKLEALASTGSPRDGAAPNAFTAAPGAAPPAISYAPAGAPAPQAGLQQMEQRFALEQLNAAVKIAMAGLEEVRTDPPRGGGIPGTDPESAK